MRDYNPKRRTAVVFTGSGSAGAYHAGALRALDESGVKIDLVVGSGVGTLAAAFSAVAGGSKLYGKAGFWDGLAWSSLIACALRRVGPTPLAAAFAVFLPLLILALLRGLLFPLALIVDLASPGFASALLGGSRRRRRASAARTWRSWRPRVRPGAWPWSPCASHSSGGGRPRPSSRPHLAWPTTAVLRSVGGRAGPCISAAAVGDRAVEALCPSGGEPGPTRFPKLILRAADLEPGGRPSCSSTRPSGVPPRQGPVVRSRGRRPGVGRGPQGPERHALPTRSSADPAPGDLGAPGLLPAGRNPRGRDAPRGRRVPGGGVRRGGGRGGWGGAGHRGHGHTGIGLAASAPPRAQGPCRRRLRNAGATGRGPGDRRGGSDQPARGDPRASNRGRRARGRTP
jgi:hypothetical protein